MEGIQVIIERFEELERLLTDHAERAQTAEYTGWRKEHARLSKVVGKWRVLQALRREIEETRAVLDDPELRDMAKEELEGLTQKEQAQVNELDAILLDTGEPAVASILIEIRPGTGGEEAALFAGDLYRMYTKYVQKRGWKLGIMDLTQTDLGGIKQATISVEGEEAYACLRFESGTHRVQRVPKTEASGRIHTSAATIAVLPEQEDNKEIEIRKEDLSIDTYSAGGPGGQHVNKTSSAVRMTHKPTGIIVACQEERSQRRNRELALRWLKAILADKARQEQKDKIDSMRRNQIGSGDRSEKIRTYNFPQKRVTDHRIHFSIHSLEAFLDGDMDPMINALVEEDRARRRKAKAKK